MDDIQRGARRARRVAQNSAAIRTPEVASSPVGPSIEGEPQFNAAQRLLMDYYEARGTPPSQRVGPHLTPEGLPATSPWQTMFASSRQSGQGGAPESRPTAQDFPDEEEYTSPEENGEEEDVGDELEDDDELGRDQLEDELEEQQEANTLPFDPSSLGLKEISNLGKFTVSSHKPGSGVEELRSDDTELYWQSDGPQPHKLTVYFVKRVGIRDIRFYVDYQRDESYTPTKIIFRAGTSENNLIDFHEMSLTTPSGWQQVPLEGVGGGPDDNTLACWVFQMKIAENHQNGKDTHLRGIKIYAANTDTRSADRGGNPMANMVELIESSVQRPSGVDQWTEEDSEMRIHRLDRRLRAQRLDAGEGDMDVPDFMREPQIR
ncbi:anaphase-promoting complex subunit 10 [Plectosphaerella cucumerina]|uniref:Anaphase-promoting complex subunit 10 n=1 Tax=Plectosphaerella cucumerina TaxID=40658 RepID=A0A8K0T4T8_9PEZI|nr:anaphase-promoting complex subunit 10 [Plectosphaerella cucumerina]